MGGALGLAAAMVLLASGSALAKGPIAVDCGQGADLQAAIDSAKPGAVLAISGTCVGTFTVSKSLTLKGVSAAVIDARAPINSPASDPALTILSATVTVKKLMVTGANSADRSATDFGGAVRNTGTLTLNQVTVTHNVGDAVGGVANAGTLTMTRSAVVANDGADSIAGLFNTGTARVERSTISDGIAGVGISNGMPGDPGSLTLVGSTVSGNREMPVSGAGIANVVGDVTIIGSTIAKNYAGNEDPGGIMNAGTMTIVRSTISGNEGDGWGGIRTVGALTITASIVTGNEAYGEASNCAGLFTSGGYNLLGSDCADSATATDIAADDPLLRPLARIGGLTATMAPRPVSPATDAIPIGSELCPAAGTTDQRGLPRPREAGCEIGSVERQPTS